jgi:transcriptional regulator with XRE-family HTH domain
MEIYAARVADRIKEYRRAQGLTQLRLAEIADMSLENIKDIESGKRNPTLRSLVKIAHALGISPSELLAEPAEEGSPDAMSQS